jgi:hypothetical protein
MTRKILYRGVVKSVPDVLTYRGQDFVLVGVRPHTNKRGEPMLLAEWRGACRTCGEEYVTARIPTKSAKPALRCAECRP